MKKCDVSVCKARCCYNVPFPEGYDKVYKKHIVNPIIDKEQYGSDEKGNPMYMYYTSLNADENKCPWLKANCRCAIYERRPNICRIFGTTPNVRFLNCHFLSGIPDKIEPHEMADALMTLAMKLKLMR